MTQVKVSYQMVVDGCIVHERHSFRELQTIRKQSKNITSVEISRITVISERIFKSIEV